MKSELDELPIRNIANGSENDGNFDFVMSYLYTGEEIYQMFVESRLVTKVDGLFQTIKRNNPSKSLAEKKISNKIDPQAETINAMKFIQYANHRNYPMEELLKYEIAPTAFYLLDKDGMMKKPNKSQLSKELMDKLSVTCTGEIPNSDCIIFDFMAYVRKIPVGKIRDKGKTLSTFGDFFKLLFEIFTSMSKHTSTIHIVFDLYKPFSIKDSERRRRGKDGEIKVAISSDLQKLPGDMGEFWNASQNKIRFQQSFILWVLNHYKENKTVVLGGGSKEDPNLCFSTCNGSTEKIPDLYMTHEEADDRIMAHIEYAAKNGAFHIAVASSDTDILTGLLYNAPKWMNCYNMQNLWNVRGSSKDRKAVPIHILLSDIGVDVALVLPSLHSLTGCDSVSKVGTK